MKTVIWIVALSALTFIAGCASAPPRVTGTEGVTDATDQVESVVGSVEAVDSDGDSIVDADDLCADTDSQALVDVSGCEVPMGVIAGLTFEPSQVSLAPDAEQVLDRYVDVLSRYPDVMVAVEGHTDNRGPAASNLELSKERVLTVVRYMVSNGINPQRIRPYGYGESRPRAANATAEGREQNRRIEIKVVDGLL